MVRGKKKTCPVDVILVSDDFAMIRNLILFFCIFAACRKAWGGEIDVFWSCTRVEVSMCVCVYINTCTQTLLAASTRAEIHPQQSVFEKHSPAAPAHSWALTPIPSNPTFFPKRGAHS